MLAGKEETLVMVTLWCGICLIRKRKIREMRNGWRKRKV
jgi:hypothetical protein